uniref:biotin/lipoyl-binding protein n=1 Tax=Methylobacterium sp. B34 TaxID=95563 RepID=UPI000FE140B1
MPEEQASGSTEGSREPEVGKRTARWPFLLAGVIVLGFVGGVLWVIFKPRPDVWTDDAYVRAHYAAIAPRVSGQIVDVRVDDNDLVKVGDLLALLDPRDYEAAVAAAEAQVERDQAQSGESAPLSTA